MKFQEHGNVKIEVNGQIIISHVVGPWNIELVELSRKLVTPHIIELSKQGYWALIVQLSGISICPPDAILLIKEGVDKDISEGKRVCTSYAISPESEGYHLMLPIWHDIYRGKIPFDIFDTLDEALIWSNQQLREKSKLIN